MEVIKRRASFRSLKLSNVFLNGNGFKVEQSRMSQHFRKALEKAGIKNLRFHDLRHTFGSRLAQRGIDLFTISRLMGHKDINTTMRYLHHSVESLRVGVSALNFDYNLTTVPQRRFGK